MLGGLISDWSIKGDNFVPFICAIINIGMIAYHIYMDHNYK